MGLSENDLISAIQKNNIKTFEELQKITNCSTGCGTCENKIRNFLNAYIKKYEVSKKLID